MQTNLENLYEEHSNSAACTRILHTQLLDAAVAATEVLEFALSRLQDVWSALPDGSEKEKLSRDKSKLVVALFEARMMAIRLLPQDEFEREGFTRQSDHWVRL